MKPEIHPETTECTISCVCGASIKTVSVQSDLRIDVCSKCHPFFTGQQTRFIDTAGRVESFRKRYGITDKS